MSSDLSHVRPWRHIERRKSRQIMVGNVPVGGDAPITVQTMTNTLTSDAVATIDQIRRCEEAGADLIRVSCPDEDSTAAFRKIAKAARVPLIADIHFHYKRALEAADAGAACLRINPGNIGDSKRVAEVVRAAKANGCAIRIGVNAGSLEKDLLEKYGEPCPEAMVESALDHARILQDHDFHEFKISVKASDVFLAAAAYQQLAAATDAPIHLGITEAGGLMAGTVKSAIGLGNLLWMGIGDTIRFAELVQVGFARRQPDHPRAVAGPQRPYRIAEAQDQAGRVRPRLAIQAEALGQAHHRAFQSLRRGAVTVQAPGDLADEGDPLGVGGSGERLVGHRHSIAEAAGRRLHRGPLTLRSSTTGRGTGGYRRSHGAG